jgi:hypothetical protein
MKKVLIIDTSILCVYLDVPKMEPCGPRDDQWDKSRVRNKIEAEENDGTTFVLPLASIIETGNHIANAVYSQFDCAKALAELIRKSADGHSPWAAFSEQTFLWSKEKLKNLADTWPNLAVQRLSLADATIKDVAEYYAQTGFHVEILTGDQGLKAYEPVTPAETPRRRQNRKIP